MEFIEPEKPGFARDIKSKKTGGTSSTVGRNERQSIYFVIRFVYVALVKPVWMFLCAIIPLVSGTLFVQQDIVEYLSHITS